jgi:hypothetical protein
VYSSAGAAGRADNQTPDERRSPRTPR